MNRCTIQFLIAAAVIMGLMPACRRNSQTAPASPEEFFQLILEGRNIEVQLSITDVEKQKGLMHRRSLGENEGMLFIYRQPRNLSFWMRNTLIPLDIGYFTADGILREIHPLYPHDENSVGSHSDVVQYALEMNQGWFSTQGIIPGAQLDMESLKAAVIARGFNPRRLGIP